MGADMTKQENLKLDLAAPGVAKAVAKRIAADIDKYNIETYDGGHRWHLGASLIGDECKRKLWYIFRWCFRETAPTPAEHARKQRLFNRGHREEARFIEWLEGIGAEVWFENYEGLAYHAESDCYVILGPDEEGDGLAERVLPNNAAFRMHIARAKADGLEFPQYRVSAVLGHFGGSLDGIAKLPAHYGIEEAVLLEFKTNGTGAGFNKLVEKGMPVAKSQHYAQTSTYGSDPKYNFRFVLYFNINKNDDSLHVELAKLDHRLGENMRVKAEQIILSPSPPSRLSDNPTYQPCTWCAAKEICHKNALPERNCRSCKNARPVEAGEWFCDVHGGVIPREFVPQACSSYMHVTALTQNV